MKLNKKSFLAILTTLGFQLFLAINTAFAASQCYEIKTKACNWEMAHAGNGKEHRQSISDQYNCELNEQQYSEKMFKIHDDQRSNVSSSEIDKQINYYQEDISKSRALGLATHREELELCFWQEKKNYYQQGSKANTTSNQKSSSGASSSQTNSGSSSQSNSPQTSTQSANSQTNTGSSSQTSSNKDSNRLTMECIKLNYNKTKTVNMCKFPITLSYCLLHQDDQSIQVANSCYDGFVTETVYPGRAVSDESIDTRFFSVACKFPKTPKNAKFVNFNTPPSGGCQ